MNKINEFFEKHVQWIALGLAGAWLLFVGWTYWFNRPEIDVNGTKFSPATVDEYIRDNDANALAMKVANPNMPPGLVDVPDFTDAFVKAMGGPQPSQLPAYVWNSAPAYKDLDFRKDVVGPIKEKIKGLPNVIAPTELAVVSGRSQVIEPAEKPKILTVANVNGDNANANNETAQPPSQPQP